MEELNERIFEDHVHLTIEKIVAYINEKVKEHNDLIETDDNMTRWLTVSQVPLSKEEEQRQFIEETKYIDELTIPKQEKIQMITTLASILITGLVPISQIDLDSLFVLTSYLKDVDDDIYQEELKLLGNSELLYQVRYSTLDNEKRVKLIQYIASLSKKEKLNLNDSNGVKAFQEKIGKLLKEKSANQLLGMEEYITVDENIVYH